jgi:hypothetical protein
MPSRAALAVVKRSADVGELVTVDDLFQWEAALAMGLDQPRQK